MNKLITSAGTAADSNMQPIDGSSSPTIGNTFVASSFNPPTMPTHPSTYAAHVMLHQIEIADQCCSHWLLFSLYKLLVERPDLTVKELICELEILCPKSTNSVSQRLIEHGMTT